MQMYSFIKNENINLIELKYTILMCNYFTFWLNIWNIILIISTKFNMVHKTSSELLLTYMVKFNVHICYNKNFIKNIWL